MIQSRARLSRAFRRIPELLKDSAAGAPRRCASARASLSDRLPESWAERFGIELGKNDKGGLRGPALIGLWTLAIALAGEFDAARLDTLHLGQIKPEDAILKSGRDLSHVDRGIEGEGAAEV